MRLSGWPSVPHFDTGPEKKSWVCLVWGQTLNLNRRNQVRGLSVSEHGHFSNTEISLVLFLRVSEVPALMRARKLDCNLYVSRHFCNLQSFPGQLRKSGWKEAYCTRPWISRLLDRPRTSGSAEPYRPVNRRPADKERNSRDKELEQLSSQATLWRTVWKSLSICSPVEGEPMTVASEMFAGCPKPKQHGLGCDELGDLRHGRETVRLSPGGHWTLRPGKGGTDFPSQR